MISFEEAVKLVREEIKPLSPRKITLVQATNHVSAEDVYAKVNVPGRDVSLKDGYAVISEDISRASPENPVPLHLRGEIYAGSYKEYILEPGTCVRVTAGAPLPKGTTAVLAEEFSKREKDIVLALTDAPHGKNILFKGTDISAGSLLLSRGSLLSPTKVGLLAAGGISEVLVFPRPRILIIATGNEIVAPGQKLRPGQIFASNLVTLSAWCQRFGFENQTLIVADEEKALQEALQKFLGGPFDALLTSGGAWRGPRDMVVRILDEAGWKKIFHRVRIGPGKAVAFGLFKKKVVFCLPGGPPSNQMAFLSLALPGLFLLAGFKSPPFLSLPVRLKRTLRGERGWTQIFLGKVKKERKELSFEPLPIKSRLSYLAEGEALAFLPEGQEILEAGSLIWVKLFESVFEKVD